MDFLKPPINIGDPTARIWDAIKSLRDRVSALERKQSITWRGFRYNTNWVDFGRTDGRYPARYAVDTNGWVTLRGIVQANAPWSIPNTMVFLPEGSRPSTTRVFYSLGFANGNPTWARVDVHPNGNVDLNGIGGTYGGGSPINLVCLDGVSFWAAA